MMTSLIKDDLEKKEMPIRVLCVFGSLDRGGSETMCMNLYRHIDRDIIQFDFVKHTEEKGAYEEEIKSLGGRIFVAPRFSGFNLHSYQNWWRKHLTGHPEHKIIHGHYFTISKYYFSVCKKYNRITVGHCHTDAYRNPLGYLLIHGVESLCDYRLACSNDAGKLLYPHRDFQIIKNAIDANAYIYNPALEKEVREEFSLEDSFVIGAIGTIKEVKNPLGIVDVFSAVLHKNPNSKLLWVGNDGGMKTQAIEKINKLRLTDKVVFTGVRSDIPRLLQGMSAFIMPSFSEGIPVALVEAQAAGLPCYVSDSVSKEADITGSCYFLPLDKWERWSVLIDRVPGRDNNIEKIKNAGYDIRKTAKWIQDYYLKMI